MLLTIIGAGASFDSSPSHPLTGLSQPIEARPPLANHLFDDRPLFADVLSAFPECHAIIPYLRKRKVGDSVERVLQRFRMEALEDPQRYKQLAAIRYYLQSMLWSCENQWMGMTKGITNQTTLIDQLRHLGKRGEQSPIVTFNYDTLIERSLGTVGLRFESIQDYVSHASWKLIKLHGSINWAREIDTPISMANRGNGTEVAREVIDRADNLEISQRYRLVQNLPGNDRPDVGLFPAIAIPVEDKDEFECPDAHVTVLSRILPNVDKMLIIGWRAGDRLLLELMSKAVKRPIRGLIVAGGKKDAEETITNVRTAGIDCQFEIAEGGFTRFITSQAIGSLLN